MTHGGGLDAPAIQPAHLTPTYLYTTMSNERTFYVSANGAISLPGGRMLHPGTRVKESVLPPKRIEEFLKQGWLSETAADAKASRPGSEVTGAKSKRPPAIGSSNDPMKPDDGSRTADVPSNAAQRVREQLQEARSAGAKPVEPVTQPVAQESDPAPTAAGFSHDPDALMGRSVDELCEMVHRVDPDMDVSELDEAGLIAVLSAEFDSGS